MFLHGGKLRLSLDRPLIMGVVNTTPDSFPDGDSFADSKTALAHARQLIAEGADIIDIGGESTRPGSAGVALDEERSRVLPVLEQLAGGTVPVSVDTQKPELMREAIAAGASMINDINALQEHEALAAVAPGDVAICLMHMRGTPADMQIDPEYADVVAEVQAFHEGRVRAAYAAGIAPERIVIDPGFGFGKTLEHNLQLLAHLARLCRRQGARAGGQGRSAPHGADRQGHAHFRLHARIVA